MCSLVTLKVSCAEFWGETMQTLTKPKSVPRYVELAERAMAELFHFDLWRMAKVHRDRLICAALDAEMLPGNPECNIEAAVWDEWRLMKFERANRRRL
jgi:hypothetical protein